MIKRGARPKAGFYVLSNEIINDNLSWAARGLLVYLLSKPDDWSVNVKQLVAQTAGTKKPSGRDAVYSLLDELEDAGYITKEQERLPAGKFSVMTYVVAEMPAHNGNKPLTDLPLTDLPLTANTGPLINTETSLQKTEYLRNDIAENAPTKPDGLRPTGTPEKMVELYKAIACDKTDVRAMTDKRIKSCEKVFKFARQYLKDKGKACEPENVYSWLRGAFKQVERSSFLCGQVKPANGRKPFLLTFDWLMNVDNLTKLIEGQYSDD